LLIAPLFKLPLATKTNTTSTTKTDFEKTFSLKTFYVKKCRLGETCRRLVSEMLGLMGEIGRQAGSLSAYKSKVNNDNFKFNGDF
jgi:hypothetical protein